MSEFHYSWTYDLESTPEALWPLASDTNRFNRDTGLPPVEMLGIQNRVKRIRFRLPVISIEWDEEPFEWTYPYRFGVLRRYRSGPLREMRVDCRIERREQGSRLTYQVWATPRNLLGRVAIPLGIGIYSAKRFRDTFHRYDRMTVRAAALPPGPRRWNLTFGEHRRFQTLSKRLLEQKVDQRLLDHLYDFLHRADEISIQRMRPYVLADAWGLPRRTVLEAFLRGTRAGLLDMYWELLCPECRGVSEGHGRLSDVRGDSHCNTCNIDFKANFDHNVEVIFRPNPAVRPVQANVDFCVGSPQRQPHVLLSLMVPAGEVLPVDTMLDPGRYAFRTKGLPGSQPALAVEQGPEKIEVRAHATGWSYGEASMGLKPRIQLMNRTDADQTFELDRTAWSDQAATAADVTALQVFRDLFASEVIRPGEEISVGAVTLMFTDLRGSTRLYRDIGDAPAFGRVREHFAALERAVTDEGGAIIKTMGDSVMAAFRSPAASLRAVWAAQKGLARFEPRLWLKVGIHHGPCIVVNLNERLDYFGSTVNVAARLPNFSTGGEVIFSDPIRFDPEARQFFEQTAAPGTLTGFQAEIKGYEEPIGLWRLKF
jgi:class 3 adenylate cyclase